LRTSERKGWNLGPTDIFNGDLVKLFVEDDRHQNCGKSTPHKHELERVKVWINYVGETSTKVAHRIKDCEEKVVYVAQCSVFFARFRFRLRNIRDLDWLIIFRGIYVFNLIFLFD